MIKGSIRGILAALLCIAIIGAGTAGYTAVFADEAEPEKAASEEDQQRPGLSVDFIGNANGYSVKLYDNSNGLPTSEANALAQTEDGFIWIGSYSGLIRYDGSNFERISSAQGITSVVSLYVDSRKRLWIGTNDGGAVVMDRGDQIKYDRSRGLSSLSVRAIVEAANGDIYLATTHGIAKVSAADGSLSMLGDARISDSFIRELLMGADETIYGITLGGDVFTLKDDSIRTFIPASYFGNEPIHTILPDPDRAGYAYLGTIGSSIYYGRLSDGFEKEAEYSVAPQLYLNCMQLADGLLWVCSDTGICFVEGDTVHQLEDVPIDVAAENMLVDYQGNLWFASSQQGVMKIVSNRFFDLFGHNYMQSEVINATCLYGDDLFIGTKNNGIIVLRNEKDRLYGLPLEYIERADGRTYENADLVRLMEGGRIRSISKDSAGNLWICGFGENPLVRYDGRTARVFSTADGLPSDRIRAVYDNGGNSYTVVGTGGVVLLENDRVTRVYNENDGITNTEVLTVTKNSKGETVIGTDGGGMFIIGSDGVRPVNTTNGLSSDIVMRVKWDDESRVIWIVTSNSLSYMTESDEVVTINDFPYSNNFDLYRNALGEMWILSSNGIYVADTDELLANEEINAEYYGFANGLPCIATANSYSELTDDGVLYISGTTGVAKVNINEEYDAISSMKMSVPFVEADGVLIYPEEDGSFRLDSDVRKLTIFGYVYNYSLTEPQVTYWLDGFDETSTTVEHGEMGPVVYTNLKGGDYRFVMRVTDFQSSEVKELSVTIVKRQAFKETMIFKTALGVLLAAATILVVILFLNYQKKRYDRKVEEDRKLVSEIVEAFAKVIDMKDKYTNGHSSRVADYTVMLAEELGCDEETIYQYRNIALLHDIGKIGIPEEVLNKPGKLTDEEYAIIQSHSELGYETLKGINIMPGLADGAHSHHERPDGKGYPQKLGAEEIPRVAQIIAVADTFDAMYSNRPYRKRMNFDRAVSIIQEVSGSQLAPDVVDAFMRLVEKGKLVPADDDTGEGTTENIDNIRKKSE